LLNDGAELRIYVPLEGPLEEVRKHDIEAEFDIKAFKVMVRTVHGLFKLHIDPVGSEIEPEFCGIKVSKSRKLVVTLRKKNEKIEWETLHPKIWM
jgi:hypothetical protein